MIRFDPHGDHDLAYRCHLVGLHRGGAYRRQDQGLRRTAGAPPYRHGADHAWFERRQSLGEREAMLSHASNLSEALAAWPEVGPTLGDSCRITVSAAAPPLPFAVTRPQWHLVAQPDTSAAMATLALVAARVRATGALKGIRAWDRPEIGLHCAGAELVNDPALTGHLDELLKDAARSLLPSRPYQAAYTEWVIDYVSAYGDQPPGEIERLAAGLALGRVDRLHRAWKRRFFHPRSSEGGA